MVRVSRSIDVWRVPRSPTTRGTSSVAPRRTLRRPERLTVGSRSSPSSPARKEPREPPDRRIAAGGARALGPQFLGTGKRFVGVAPEYPERSRALTRLNALVARPCQCAPGRSRRAQSQLRVTLSDVSVWRDDRAVLTSVDTSWRRVMSSRSAVQAFGQNDARHHVARSSNFTTAKRPLAA